MSESPAATSESVGEGVANWCPGVAGWLQTVSGCRAVVLFTLILLQSYRIGWGGCG